MAFAVLIDASLVRMILVPSIMALLDARAWWMPRWLELMVPHLQLEGSTTPPAPAAPEPAGPAKTKTAEDKTDKEAETATATEAETATATGARRQPSAK